MTAEARVLFDARGGGHGHAMRARMLAEMLIDAGHHVTLHLRAGSDLHVSTRARVELDRDGPPRLDGYDTLIVDTFARGFGGEWDADALARVPRRVLIARYRRDGEADPDRLYHELWLPYCEAHDEWPTRTPQARYLGLLARTLPLRIDPQSRSWVVFDPGGRVNRELHEVFARLARETGRPLEIVPSLSGSLRAGKLLCVGAGYGTTYELCRLTGDVRFLPLARRYDDQHRRAALLNRDVGSLPELRAWLARDGEPRALPSSYYASPTLGRTLL